MTFYLDLAKELSTSEKWTINVGSKSMFICFTGKSGNNKYIEEWNILNPNYIRFMKRIDLSWYNINFFENYVSAKSDFTDFFYILGHSVLSSGKNVVVVL